MTIAAGITVPDADVAAICKRYQVRELSVFGSAARGDMKPDSDVDLLVEFEPEARTSLLEVTGLIEDFSALVGRRVDIAIKRALKPRIRSGVLAEARLLYAA
jgi:predicted nucleotidyltransferase